MKPYKDRISYIAGSTRLSEKNFWNTSKSGQSKSWSWLVTEQNDSHEGRHEGILVAAEIIIECRQQRIRASSDNAKDPINMQARENSKKQYKHCGNKSVLDDEKRLAALIGVLVA